MSNFWQELQKPFLVLAPMEDVTDMAFRELIALHLPKPDVFFTEFTSSDGLASVGRDKTIKKLTYSNKQRPIVAQIWGTDPDKMLSAAKLVQELKFDGVDINMGCPDRKVMKQGAGAAACTNPGLAKEIISAVKEGAGEIAVSVKTRLGKTKNIADTWIPFLLEQQLAALTVHGRTAVQKSEVDANWEEIGKCVEFRNKIAPETVLVGNGDIKSYHQAIEMHQKYGVDGVMIGRGIFTNPWVFDKADNPQEHTKEEYIDILLKHVRLFDVQWGTTKNFEIMKKFFKMYVREFEGASELRQELMTCKTATAVEQILANK